MIYLSILCFAIAGLGQTSPVQPKPAVMAVSQNPTDLDHWVVERQNPANVRKLVEKRKLVTKEFRDFTFYYSPKLLGLEDSKNQAKLLNEISKQLTGKSRVLDVSQLSESSQATLHGMLASVPGDDEFHTVANSPDLKLSGGIQSQVGIHYGSVNATYTLSDEPRLSDWKSLVQSRPTNDQISSWKQEATKGTFDKDRPVATPFLAFVYTSTTDSIHKLEFLEQAQAYLKEQCIVAKREFDEAAKNAMKSVYGDFAKRYQKLDSLDRMPTFGDLNQQDQDDVRRMFRMSGQSGSTDPSIFLNYATTDSFSTNFGLTVMYRDGDNPNAAHVVPIPIQCPIGF